VHAPTGLLPALHVEAVAAVDDDAGSYPVGEQVGLEVDELWPLGQHQDRVQRLAQQLAQNAYEESRRYQWDVVREQWLRVYRTLCAPGDA